MAITTLLWDVGDVIINADYQFVVTALRGIVVLTIEQFKLVEKPLWKRLRTGSLMSKDFYKQLMGGLGIPYTTQNIAITKWAYQELYAHEDLQVVGFIRALRDANPQIRMVLASNACFDFEERAEGDGLALLGLMDHAYYSHRLGVAKPDPAFYRKITEREGLAAECGLMIDDKEANIVAARDVGLHGIRFTDLAQLEKDLSDYGFRFRTEDSSAS